MMGHSRLLGALLGVQLLVIGAVLFVESGAGDTPAGVLVEFAPDQVDELRVGAPDQAQPVVIRRTDDVWQLEDGLPADPAKVNEMLEKLADLKAPWAVATSASARRRFEVTDEEHQRHVVILSGGETVAELYLGTSPGYQQVHARSADSDAVFSVALSNYQLPVETDEWLDRQLLQPEGTVTALARLETWNLRREEDTWQLDGAAADPEAADDLVRRFAELRVSGLAEVPADGIEPTVRYRLVDAAGEYTLSLYSEGDEGGAGYVVASTRREGRYFGLAGYLAEQMLVDRDALLPSGQAPAGDDADAGG